MKTIKFSTLLFGLCIFLLTSCVKDDDFGLPDMSTKIPPFKGEIISLEEAVKNSSEKVQTYKENHAIEGYVISSDQGGNYYDKIYVQTLDGEDGFSIAIKKSGLYGVYPIGIKVQLRLQGMTTQVVNNKLEAGYEVYKETNVGKMPTGIYKASVINTGESIDPRELAHEIKALKDLDKDKYLNKLITIKRVAFESAAVGKPYHQKSNDIIYGTNYKLLDSLGGSLIFRTSKFAKFKTEVVPKEKVNVTGIITKYKTTYQFQPNTIKDIEIIEGTNGEDNDGDSTPDAFKPKTVSELNETFDAVTPNKDITLEGWYLKAAKGNRNWQGKDFSGNKFIQASAFKSGLETMEAWIVTPGLDLSAASKKNFTFETQSGYSKEETLEVFISSNFDYKQGIEAATWKKLAVTLAEKNATSYSKFVTTGDIDLSSYSGTVNIAFKYTGNTNNASGTWRIDNIKFNYTSENDDGENDNFVSKTVTELNETFDAVTPNKDITLEGWYLKAAKGDRNWQGKDFSGNKFIQASAFKSGLETMEAWIVTPGLDLSAATKKNFTFETQSGHSQEETLEVFISSNFDYKQGIEAATWEKLAVTLAEKNATGYSKFVTTGDINLSSYNGTVNIAFKYTGNTNNASGTWRIDNIKFNYITGNDNGGDNGNDNGGDDNGDDANAEGINAGDNSVSGASDLFFSEYVEGSSSNKYLEIFNGTGAEVDLSKYAIKVATNGKKFSNPKVKAIALSGKLPNGATLVIQDGNAKLSLPDGKTATKKFPKTTWFNGDDAVGLLKDSKLIDVFGIEGEDPGKGWTIDGTKNATADHTLVRASSVKSPNTTWTTNEWTIKDKDDVSNLGSHSMK